MKTTRYFDYRRTLPDRADIADEWIEAVVARPEKTEVQGDGRIKMWAKVNEAGGKYLRVVLLEDRETVHNAFFDRGYRR